MANLNETIGNLRQLSEMSRALYHGLRKAQVDLKDAGVEIPEIVKRDLHRLDMDLDDLATDLDQMLK